MSNQKTLFSLIAALSGQANVLTVPKIYIQAMGSIDGGLLLSQMIYWSDKGKREDGYFYKSYAEWEEETTLSKYEVGKNVKIMVAAGFLETKLAKANGAPTVHYKFSIDDFQKWIVKKLDNGKLSNLTMESEKTSQSLTETTPETTSEIYNYNDYGNLPENLQSRNVNAELGKINSLLENCGLFLSSPLASAVQADYDELKVPANETKYDWFEYAITAAVKNNAVKLVFIERVLDQIQKAGSLKAHKLNRAEQKQQGTTTERGNNGLRKGNRGTQDDEWAEYTARSQEALAQRIAAVTVS